LKVEASFVPTNLRPNGGLVGFRKQAGCFPFHVVGIRPPAGKVKFDVWPHSGILKGLQSSSPALTRSGYAGSTTKTNSSTLKGLYQPSGLRD
jgi:hypothetical protein